MSNRVAGKLAIVTGAGQGLGEASAWMLARQGARVLLTDIVEENACANCEAINAACGAGTAFSMPHDVSQAGDWERVVDAARSELGGLSVLVNNAGISIRGSVEELTYDEWNTVMRVNADSVFLGVKYALPLMHKNTPGSIVNISSISGLIASHNLAAYNASKAAVWMLTKSIALHCARSGADIRCNSIHPTYIRTPILDTMGNGGDREELLQKLARQVPLKRLGEPDDVAHAVVYLASDESRFMTGAEIKLDGGISAM